MWYISDNEHPKMNKPRGSELKSRVLEQVLKNSSTGVWTANDFATLGTRSAVDKVLQRLARTGDLRRIDRGLYDRPTSNELTGKMTVPDYRAVIQAVARRDNVRFLLDGMTAANDLGLTTAVPARIEVLVDGRLKPIRIGNQVIYFKMAAPSRLFWAGRPAMRIVQALYWMQDLLSRPEERQRAAQQLRKVVEDKDGGSRMRDDLRSGFSALPIWMQEFVAKLLKAPESKGQPGNQKQ